MVIPHTGKKITIEKGSVQTGQGSCLCSVQCQFPKYISADLVSLFFFFFFFYCTIIIILRGLPYFWCFFWSEIDTDVGGWVRLRTNWKKYWKSRSPEPFSAHCAVNSSSLRRNRCQARHMHPAKASCHWYNVGHQWPLLFSSSAGEREDGEANDCFWKKKRIEKDPFAKRCGQPSLLERFCGMWSHMKRRMWFVARAAEALRQLLVLQHVTALRLDVKP